jgi:biotin carboxylase
MTRVLLLSHTTGYQLRAFNDAAEALGIELVFATDRCRTLEDPWQDRAIAVRFHDLDASVDAVVERARAWPVDGVIAVGDRPVVLAARAAEALGLQWHSVAGAAASTDKCRSRAILAAAGLPAPRFSLLSAAQPPASSLQPPASNLQPPAPRTSHLASRTPHLGPRTSPLGFPVVLKPLGLSGSRGVIRANDEQEFDAAFERIRALLARPQVRTARTGLGDEILVEEYIDGREYALEGVLTDGALRVFALFDKPDPLEGPFFEETIYVTPSRLPATAQAAIVDHVQRAGHALGLWHGPIHAECRIARDGAVYILEVAARPIGGLCSRVLTFVGAKGAKGPEGARGAGAGGAEGANGAAEGASLEEMLLRHAVGESIDGWARESTAAAVMMIPIPARGFYKGVRGEEQARAVKGVTEVRITAKVGQLLETLPEAGSYLGFIFAKGRIARDAEIAVRDAHRELVFDIAREVKMTSSQLPVSS